MCFTSLPIEFDGDGCARLDEGRDFAVQGGATATLPAPPASANGHETRELNLDPVTRVAGALAFHTTLDLTDGVVTEAIRRPFSSGVTS